VTAARPDLRALTSIRGIAAWLVVLYHIRLSMNWAPDTLIAVFAKGYLAVDFFFLLSGFVLWLTYADQLHQGGGGGAARFLQRRVARIWPLHLLMLAGAACFATALAVTGRPNAAYPFGELPLHILLIQSWGLTDELHWNDPAWSISAEFAAYLAFPVLATAVDWRRLPDWGLVAIGLAPLIALWLLFAGLGHATLGQDITHLGVLRCLAEFTTGTVVCALWQRWRDRPMLPALSAAGIALAIGTAWIAGALPEPLAVPVAFAALLLALALSAEWRSNPLNGRVVHYLGEISYATYLSHFLLFVAFKLAFVDDPRAVPPGLIALYLALVAAASVVLYHVVERPAQRLINRLSWPQRAPRAATSH